ncbi:MAG: diaminopimelate epimerase [Gammaproteobacteria bacterium]|nr:diaminopimelate epimerase [Gammaproteobacteria bacterium]MDH3559325.1 diaminopimelate epimerase [Gammaproteobacteria bacterium]
MQLEFSKMHGLGNDFVVIDAINQVVALSPEQVCLLADRRYGIGCDQLLLVEASTTQGTDFRYRIFNADGGEVGQCGNGARCFMRFMHDQGLTDKRELTVETASGRLQLVLEDDGQVTVNMGEPRLLPAEIPFDAPAYAQSYTLAFDGEEIEIAAVSMGNPHAVTLVVDIDTAPVERLGPLIERHPRFPERVNAGFMQISDFEHIRLRVYERGVGETRACGSGACAAVVAGRLWDQLAARVNVALRGGNLVVSWAGKGYPVYMTGPATQVFTGRIEL